MTTAILSKLLSYFHLQDEPNNDSSDADADDIVFVDLKQVWKKVSVSVRVSEIDRLLHGLLSHFPQS